MRGEKILCGNLAELIFNGAHWNLSGRIQTSHKYFNEAVQLILCCKFNEIEGFSAQFLRDAGNPAEIFQRARMKNFNEKIFFFSGQKVKKQRRTDDKMAEIRPKNEKNRKKKKWWNFCGNYLISVEFEWSSAEIVWFPAGKLVGRNQKKLIKKFSQRPFFGKKNIVHSRSWRKSGSESEILAKKKLIILGG